MIKLKPCPFCGGDPVRVKKRISGATPNQEEDGYAHYVRCTSCAASGGWSKARGGGGAVKWWNTRVDAMPSPPPQNEDDWTACRLCGVGKDPSDDRPECTKQIATISLFGIGPSCNKPLGHGGFIHTAYDGKCLVAARIDPVERERDLESLHKHRKDAK